MIKREPSEKKKMFKHRGWGQSIAMLKQLVLAQNQIQHSKTLLLITPIYAPSDLVKHLNPFFLSDHERVLLIDIENKGRNVDNMWLLRNTLYVNGQKLETVFSKVRKFSTWFDRANPLRLYPAKGKDNNLL
ncbi:hypothetical protein [Yersinia rohdei]|uniref:hypothetical protein n=1 Tax=Yersinia rohdei TaxID=29485 RepID=UPI0025AA3A91|nr:hypothetical protein [Yersinia rohdei]MDN0096491.1 hypothetical protein [Yersinia rohdei]